MSVLYNMSVMIGFQIHLSVCACFSIPVHVWGQHSWLSDETTHSPPWLCSFQERDKSNSQHPTENITTICYYNTTDRSIGTSTCGQQCLFTMLTSRKKHSQAGSLYKNNAIHKSSQNLKGRLTVPKKVKDVISQDFLPKFTNSTSDSLPSSTIIIFSGKSIISGGERQFIL